MGPLYVILLPLAAIIGLVVTVSYYLKLDPMIAKVALGVGAFAALIVTIVALIRRIRGPSAAAAAKPVDPAKQARRLLRGQRRREDREMKRRLGIILPELRAADRELRARGLADRPWWMVLGTAGHGKSRLLAAAPGARELAPGAADQPRFFSANAGVFCELPSDYPERPAAAAALRRLLRALRAARVDRPLAGVLLIRSAAAAPEAAAERDALRRSVDVICRELRVRAPLTLILTKLDQIPGFNDLCGDREHIDLGRAFGVTISRRATADTIEAAARARFIAQGGPLAWLDRHCHIAALRAQAAPERQSRLYSLWQRLHELSRGAAAFAAHLAADPSFGGDPLPVRAIYFTCAEGQAVHGPDPLYDRLARELGGAAPAPSDPPAAGPPVAFIAALFDTELPRDAVYSERTPAARRRAEGLTFAAATAALALAALAVVAATRSAAANRELLVRTAEHAVAALSPARRDKAQLRAADEFAPLHQLVDLWRAESPPPGHGWGLFRSDIVAPVLLRSYRDAVCRGVLRPLAERSQEQLHRLTRDYSGGGVPTKRERSAGLDHLRLYLLLSLEEPSPTGEPSPWGDVSQQTWLISHLTATWAPTGGDRAAAILQTYAALVERDDPATDATDACLRSRGARALARDLALVQRARALLRREHSELATVERLINAITDARPVTLINLTTSARVRGHEALEVPAAFTKDGWREFSRLAAQELASDVDDQPWVLARETQPKTSERCARLARIYIDRYESAWRRFYVDLRLDSPNSLPEASAIYRALLEDKPLAKIFKEIHFHTQDLPDITCAPPPAPPPEGTEPATPERLRDNALKLAAAFKPLVDLAIAPKDPPQGGAGEVKLGIDRYHQQLEGLYQLVEQAHENSARLGELMSALDEAIRETHGVLKRSNLRGWEGDTSRLLLPPLEGLALVLDGAIGESLNREWCEQIVLPLRRDAAARYPFDREAREHAQLSAVRDLFHPRDGAIARFRDENLRSFVILNGDRVEAKELGLEAPRRLAPAIIDLLAHAHQLGLALFPEGGDASVDFLMDMTCDRKLNKVELALGKALHSYDCSTHRKKEVHWPAEGGSDATLTLHNTTAKTAVISRTREFALFQLFEGEGAPKLDPNGSSVLLTFTRDLYGTTTVRLYPTRSRGGTVFYGFGGDRFLAPFLAPFRAPGFARPPSALFVDRPFACGAEDPQ
ncbi:MAG: hypothetical protein IPK80_07730 [Nannocystis sp.]|nr:hypothetical protein [Nannocystis sp.]